MRRARGLAGLIVACASIAGAIACLPDLAVFAPDAGDAGEAGPACGDGVVELDRGEQCDPGDGQAGCTASCALDCDGGAIDDASGHCYFWVAKNDSNSFASAQCGSAHIVSFVDPAEMAFVLSQAKNLPNAASGASWLSLLQQPLPNEAGATVYTAGPNLDVPTPGWAYTCPGCYAAVEAGAEDIMRPGSGNPQPCVDWRKVGGPWVQASCSLGFDDAGDLNTTSVLCEREPPGSFAAPCASSDAGDLCVEVPRTFGQKRYELGPARAFDVARAECHARNGVLAHFASSAEREEVVAAVAPYLVTRDFWIGLAFDGDAGDWQWDDGTPAPAQFPTPWGDLEPRVNAGAATIHIDSIAFDTALARAQSDTTQTFQYLCQLAD